jgi:NHL repeat-containing protein
MSSAVSRGSKGTLVAAPVASRTAKIFIVNRNDMTDKEAEVSKQAPPKVVNSFGDWKTVPNTTHACTIDYENNFWTAGNGDGIIQKYGHNGKLMMQIGKRGAVDTSDGTFKGRAMTSHAQLNRPSDVAVDPANGDVYVSDGYGNSRIAQLPRSMAMRPRCSRSSPTSCISAW